MNRFALMPWLIFTVFVRMLSAFTHASYAHPDEWYKTVEFSRIFTRGYGNYSQEVGLHYTNMCLPFLLSLPLFIAKWVANESMHLRIFGFQFFSGILDLGIFWAWYVCLEELKLAPKLKNFGMGLLLVPWFFVHDSIRPTNEHMSAIAAWVSLGFLVRKKYSWAGFFSVAVFAARYPSALISVGFFISIFLSELKERKFTHSKLFLIGFLAGLFIFGIPDWIVYGRPWESFWMYLQYNIFTGLSHTMFGNQPASVYLDYFSWRWYRLLFPFGFLASLFGIYGIFLGIKKFQPWAYGVLFFLLGHLLVQHKEPRFISPIEIFCLWCAFYGFLEFTKKNAMTFSRLSPTVIIFARGFCAFFLLINSVLFLRELWGETFTANLTYLEMNDHLKSNTGVCAVISARRAVTSVLYPDDGEKIPSPALGLFPPDHHSSGYAEASRYPIEWVENAPQCAATQPVLLHVWKPDVQWTQQGCELLPSGILRFVPKAHWSLFLKHEGWVSGSWYRCNSSIFKAFNGQISEKTLFSHFQKMNELPGLGTPAATVFDFGRRESPEPNCRWLCPG